MRINAIVLAGCCCCSLQAQVLRIEPGTDDPTLLHFNEAFIQRNRILSIEGQGNVKREGEPIRQKNERTTYRFDAAGRTTWCNTSYGKPGTVLDTSTMMFTYDLQGRSVERLRNDQSGWFAQRDSLDSAGRSLRRTHVRIQNLGTDRFNLTRGLETIISDERFTYAQINDTVLLKTWYNDRGLPYREETFHKDQWGYLRTIDDRNLITQRLGRILFRYDEKGRLAERIEQSDLSSTATRKHIWRYDNAGNVTLCDTWRDERQIRHTEFLYEEGTLLLKAAITKDMETGLIHITRYTTERR